MNIDERLLAYKPISITLNFDWDKMSYDERVLARHNYIEEQKKKDPNYVGYDFPEWFRSTHGSKKVSTSGKDLNKLISTIGQVITIWHKNIYTYFGGTKEDGYKVAGVKSNEMSSSVRVHRLVACTFIPIDKKYVKNKEKMVIDHKNDIKYDNTYSNLQWVTPRFNLIKELKRQKKLLPPFKFTITQIKELMGKVYYFHDSKDFIRAGISNNLVSNFARKGRPCYHGLWERITEKECKDKPRGIPKGDLYLLKNNLYGQSNTRPLIATILSEGPCKGERFVVYGGIGLKRISFSLTHPYRAAKGTIPSYLKCHWEQVEHVDVPADVKEISKKQQLHINNYIKKRRRNEK